MQNERFENVDVNKILDDIRKQIDPVDEDENTTNLKLTKEQFINKMLQEEKGLALLDLLESGEFQVVERMGLCKGYIESGTVYFNVPQWNNLVSHLKIVDSV